MRLTPRDEAGRKGTGSPPGGPFPTGQYPHAPGAAAESARNRFVIGIFGQASAACGAAKALSPHACDVLVLLGPAHVEPKAATVSDGRLTIHHLETSGALATDLPSALAMFAPFSALKQDAWDLRGSGSMSSGLPQRLFQNLVLHLAAGAAVVIVHAPDSERQIRVSLTLLEAKCDVLLTHDVVQTAGSAPPASEGDCCDTCASQSCCRIEPNHDGTTRSDE